MNVQQWERAATHIHQIKRIVAAIEAVKKAKNINELIKINNGKEQEESLSAL